MKKVEKVSIGHYAFTLDEDAFQIIKSYLEELQVFYSEQDNGSEIMEGIEERIAELFFDREKETQVVSKKMAEDIIDIIGRPSTLKDVEHSEENTPKEKHFKKKKLFRNVGNRRILGGVCSGLATYFNIDVTLFRVAYAVLTFGLTITDFEIFDIDLSGIGASLLLLYLILWVALPKANTPEKRMKQKGHDFNVDDIAQTVTSGEDAVQCDNRGKFLGRFIAIFCSIALFIIGISGISIGAVIATALAQNNLMPINDILDINKDLAPYYSRYISSISLVISSALTYFLPFIGMLYASVLGFFNISAPKWKPGLVMLLLWIASMVVLLCSLVAVTL